MADWAQAAEGQSLLAKVGGDSSPQSCPFASLLSRRAGRPGPAEALFPGGWVRAEGCPVSTASLRSRGTPDPEANSLAKPSPQPYHQPQETLSTKMSDCEFLYKKTEFKKRLSPATATRLASTTPRTHAHGQTPKPTESRTSEAEPSTHPSPDWKTVSAQTHPPNTLSLQCAPEGQGPGKLEALWHLLLHPGSSLTPA